MEQRELGKSGIQVSKICLGTMTFGEQNSEADAHEQLNYAFANGINFLDTAELYAVPSRKETQGLTEQYIGTWLKNQKRDDIIVGTKIVGPSPNLLHIRPELNYSDASIDDALEASMMRLQTDYIDLYQLHWPERKNNRFGIRGLSEIDNWEDNFLAVIQKLTSLIKEGKIRTWGLSNESPWGVMRCIELCNKHNLPKPVSIQNAYSLLNRTFEIGLAEISLYENIGLLPYSPLAMGLLTGKYHTNNDTPNDRLNKYKNQMTRYVGNQGLQVAEKYLKIALKHEISLTQMSLSFVNDRAFNTSNIFGATSMVQLKENISSASIKLSEECLADIESVHESFPNPCP
ncbi:UNVERIFIED_CONTAM: hypothetical protein GTU68_064377 [Idotea baltica]|nr:hypothetical protein [Idotea baltica]